MSSGLSVDPVSSLHQFKKMSVQNLLKFTEIFAILDGFVIHILPTPNLMY